MRLDSSLLALSLLCAAPMPAQNQNQTGAKLDQPLPVDGLLERVGKDGVSAPIVLSAPAPEFSEVARKEKRNGTVLVYLQVGLDGLPSHVHVIRGVGYGLDEKAVEAVQQYRFKPAMKDGQAVRVEMNVQIDFHVYDRPQRN